MTHNAGRENAGWTRLARILVGVTFVASLGVAASHEHADASATPDACAICHVVDGASPPTVAAAAPSVPAIAVVRHGGPATEAPRPGDRAAVPPSRAPPPSPHA